MLLVVTNKADLASDYFILRLKERGIPFVRLNTEDYGTGFQVDIVVGAAADFVIRCDNGESVASDAISAVYFRQPRTPHISSEVAPSDRAFAARELKEVLRGLWRVIPARLWLNHPRNLWLASNKIEQLHLARDFGLCVPETCITNSLGSVREFYDRHEGQIICKAVKNGFSHNDNIVTMATTKRVEADFIERFDEYAMLPMIYQQEIIKNCDVRVTIVGDKIYATAIYSQEHADTEVDWRVWDVSDLDLRHEPITLPVDIAEGCRKITAHFGLRYAAIDLVLSQDGRWYFLELNPNGQWAWIEKRPAIPYAMRSLNVCKGGKVPMGGIVEQITSKDINVLQQSLAFVRERNTAENERGKAAEARATAMLAILGILAGFIIPLAQAISAADGRLRWSLIAALLSSLTFLVKGLYHALGVLSVAKQYRLTVDTVLDFQTLSRAEALREEIAGLVWECRQAIQPNSLKLFRLHRCQRSALIAILFFMLFGLLLLAAQQQWFVSVGFAYAISILALATLFLTDRIVERRGIWRREAINTDLPAPGKSQ